MIYLFILGRILFGGYFIKSSFNHFKNHDALTDYAQSKGVPMASVAVWITGLMMLAGGLGILLGIYVQISIFLIILFLFGTLIKMHQYWKVSDSMQKMTEQVNFYKNLALIGALLMFLAIPLPWVMSLF